MKNMLIKSLYSKLKSDKDSYNFIMNLMSHYDLYLFGGGVRDLLINNLDPVRDLDFVIRSPNNEEIDLENYIPNDINFKKNRFNGYKIFFNNYTIDIWDIKNTWAFKSNLLNDSVENLLDSVYLNIDSLLYYLNENRYIKDCDKTYKNIKQLDIILEETPYEKLNLLRAIIYKNKYSLKMSNKLKEKFYKYTYSNKENLINEFMKLQKEHYNYYVYDKQELIKELSLL